MALKEKPAGGLLAASCKRLYMSPLPAPFV
jgi:hypothetical protein